MLDKGRPLRFGDPHVVVGQEQLAVLPYLVAAVIGKHCCGRGVDAAIPEGRRQDAQRLYYVLVEDRQVGVPP